MPINTLVQVRRGTRAEWLLAPSTLGRGILYAGEIGYETDSGRYKIGDGSTTWSSLKYASVLSQDFLGVSGVGTIAAVSGEAVTISVTGIQSSQVNDWSEAIQDTVGTNAGSTGFLRNGSGVAWTYNDASNTLSIAVTGIPHTLITDWSDSIASEVDTVLVEGTGIYLSYNSGANSLTIGVTNPLADLSTNLTASAAELNVLDGVTAGTVSAGDAVVVDSNKDIASFRNLTATATITAATFSGALVGNVTSNSVDINGGSIDGTIIGANSPAVVSGTSIYASSGFVGNLTGNVTGNSDTASQVKTQSTATNSDFYLTFVDSNNGSSTAETVYTDSAIKYNPSTDTLTVTNITGNIASASAVSTVTTDAGTHYLTFVDSDNSVAANETVRTDGDLSYNALTNLLSVGSVTATGTVTANHLQTATLTTTGNVQIGGDLTVAGTTTTVNSTVVEIGDNIIRVNTSGLATGGIEVRNSGTSDYKQFVWDNVDGRWELGSEDLQANRFISTVANGTAPLVVTSTTAVTNLNADYLDGEHGSYYLDWGNQTNLPDPVITVGLNGDVVGTGTYTWTNLSGSPTITLSTTIQPDSVALGTDTTGQYASTIAVAGTGLSATSPSAQDGTAYTITSNATPANTANTIVSRDASGNFSAGTITGTLSGTATNATNINISATTSTDTTTSVVLVANQATGNQSPFIDSGLTYDAQNNNLSATTFTGALAGNAATATKLATARTIELIGDVTGSGVFDGSANIQITTAVSGAGTVSLTNEASDVENYITFANDATGDQELKTNTGLRFNAASGILLGSTSAAPTTPATRLEYFIIDGGAP